MLTNNPLHSPDECWYPRRVHRRVSFVRTHKRSCRSNSAALKSVRIVFRPSHLWTTGEASGNITAVVIGFVMCEPISLQEYLPECMDPRPRPPWCDDPLRNIYTGSLTLLSSSALHKALLTLRFWTRNLPPNGSIIFLWAIAYSDNSHQIL